MGQSTFGIVMPGEDVHPAVETRAVSGADRAEVARADVRHGPHGELRIRRAARVERCVLVNIAVWQQLPSAAGRTAVTSRPDGGVSRLRGVSDGT
jgi:hypothetical protein